MLHCYFSVSLINMFESLWQDFVNTGNNHALGDGNDQYEGSEGSELHQGEESDSSEDEVIILLYHS